MKINKRLNAISNFCVVALIINLSIKLGLVIADFIIGPKTSFSEAIHFYLMVKIIAAVVSATAICSILVRLYYLLYKVTSKL